MGDCLSSFYFAKRQLLAHFPCLRTCQYQCQNGCFWKYYVGIPWQAPPEKGFLWFSGTGTFSGRYNLNCKFNMTEVDAHVGTAVWEINSNGNILNQWQFGDVQEFGNRSNYTSQSKTISTTPFSVECGSAPTTVGSGEEIICPGFSVSPGNNYILWIYVEINAFQGASRQGPFNAEAAGFIQATLESNRLGVFEDRSEPSLDPMSADQPADIGSR